MDIINKIESFAADIYFKLPNELNQDFINICQLIAEFYDENFSENIDNMNQKNRLLTFLLQAMETRDYIKMADVLLYTVKPVIKELVKLEHSDVNN